MLSGRSSGFILAGMRQLTCCTRQQRMTFSESRLVAAKAFNTPLIFDKTAKLPRACRLMYSDIAE